MLFRSLVGREELEKTKIEFRVKYENFMGKPYQRKYILDFSEFWGRRRAGHSTLIDIADNLKKIEGYISQLSSGNKKIKVATYTKMDREEESKKLKEQIEQIEKEHKKKAKKK